MELVEFSSAVDIDIAFAFFVSRYAYSKNKADKKQALKL
jgi:hypothetical protein